MSDKKVEQETMVARLVGFFGMPEDIARQYLIAADWNYSQAVTTYVVDYSEFYPISQVTVQGVA